MSWKTLNHQPLLNEIEVLRNIVAQEVMTAIAHDSLNESPRTGKISLTLQSGHRERLSRGFKNFSARWTDVLKEQLPKPGAPGRQEIDAVFKAVENAVSGRCEFRHRDTVSHEVFDLYWLPFMKLAGLTKRLSVVRNPVEGFQQAHNEHLSRFMQDYRNKTTMFLSINHADKRDNDPQDVRTILKGLEGLESKYPVKFLLAREEKGYEWITENTRFLMHACDAAMAFFTESNLQERSVEHNPNVCLELGYLTALEKSKGIFMYQLSDRPGARAQQKKRPSGRKDRAASHEGSFARDVADFALIRGLVIEYYSDPLKVDEQVGGFIENRLRIEPLNSRNIR